MKAINQLPQARRRQPQLLLVQLICVVYAPSHAHHLHFSEKGGSKLDVTFVGGDDDDSDSHMYSSEISSDDDEIEVPTEALPLPEPTQSTSAPAADDDSSSDPYADISD